MVMQAMTSMLKHANIYGTGEGQDQNFLYNFANVNLLPETQADIHGIGRCQPRSSAAASMRCGSGSTSTARAAYNISATDVNEQIAKQKHDRPAPGGSARRRAGRSQTIEYVLTWVGRYNKVEQYENIILKANPDGEILRLRDIAKVDLSASYYNIYSDMDGHPSAAIVLKQLPGTNAAIVIEEVKKKLAEIKEEARFPSGMDFRGQLRRLQASWTPSIEKVLHTLFEAFSCWCPWWSSCSWATSGPQADPDPGGTCPSR